jgi:fkbH domain
MNKTEKMKLVIWDLDNTIWDGILLEDDKVILKTGIINIIEILDQRGILQSIASKNDYSLAFSKLKEYDIDHFFILPQINWNSKSMSIRYLSKRLNIDPKFIAFIDDQKNELMQVKYKFPSIKTIDSKNIDNILSMPSMSPDFISDESCNRREIYLTDLKRQDAKNDFNGTDEGFLKTLGMHLTVKKAYERDLERITELTYRTHQLNSTGICYSHDQLREYCNSDEYLLLIAEMIDKYGDYGKIGFALIHSKKDAWTIKLFLISCRVITYGIGSLFLNLIRQKAIKEGKKLFAEYVPNEVNNLMNIAFRFTGFKEYSQKNGIQILYNDYSDSYSLPKYIKIKYELD